MKSLFAISITLCAFLSMAQTSLPTLVNGEEKISIDLNGNAFYQSTGLKNEFINKFLFGGFITEEIKDNSFAKHKLNNRIGGALFGELNVNIAKSPLKKYENLGMVFRAGWNNDFGAGYTKEEFGLLFYGNEAYLGEEISLAGTEFNNYAFQKVGFGISFAKRSSVVLNFVNASNVQRGYIFDGALTQADDASDIDLDLTAEFLSTQGDSFSQGLGFGLDADIFVEVGKNSAYNKSATLQITARNVGAVRLTENPYTYSMDSVLNYNGFRFNQLIQGENLFGDSEQLMDSLGVEKDSSNRWVMLPAHFQVAKIVDVFSEKKWQSFFGFRVITGMPFSPQVYGGAHHRFNAHFNAGAQISYGGYGGFNGGFYCSAMFDKVNFSIGTENIVGVSSRYGQGASLQFKTTINL